MRITLSITNPEAAGDDQTDLLSLDVFSDMTVETLRSSIQAETQIEPTSQHLYHNGQLISDDSKTMEQLQIGDGDMLALHVRDMRGTAGLPAQEPRESQPQQGAAGGAGGAAGARPGNTDPELIRLQILGNPRLRAEAVRQQPELDNVIDDPEAFARYFRANYDREQRERLARQRQIQQLNADPFDVEAQRRIEEMIRQERVMENLQNAMEYNPEVFGRVHMLYIEVEVNGHKLKAFVDSGAQATIMGPECAETCGIMRLVDKRFAGVARGVGTANIIGRVHTAPIKIGSLYLPCSFTVMEGKNVDLILGLDMLKRHQACIDLAKNKLIFRDVEVPFLGEADIPKDAEEVLHEPTITGPGGAQIGQRTGAVTAPSDLRGPPGGPGGISGVRPGAAQTPARTAGTPSAAAPPAAAAAVPPPPPRPTWPEEHIEQLMQLGFSREAAVNALTATGGNVEYAAGLLFQG